MENKNKIIAQHNIDMENLIADYDEQLKAKELVNATISFTISENEAKVGRYEWRVLFFCTVKISNIF